MLAEAAVLLAALNPIVVHDSRERFPLTAVGGGAPAAYGHAAELPGGGAWLQYWLFYAYQDQDRGIVRTGRHEGDWELVQFPVVPARRSRWPRWWRGLPSAGPRGTLRSVRSIVLLALLAAALLAPAARADTLTASADSPRDPGLAVGQDLARVQSTFDGAAGTWTVVVTLQGAPQTDGSAAINGILYPTGPGGCSTGASDVLAYLRASTNPQNTSVTSTVTPTTAPRAAQSTGRDAAGATITLRVTDNAFAGLRPGCLTLNLTRNGVQDALEAIPFVAAGATPPAPTPSPTATPTPTPVAPLALRFVHASARLTPSRTGIVSVALQPFSATVTGTLSIRPAHGSGRALGTATYRAKPGAAVVVRVALRAPARRSLTRARTLPVRLVATASAGSTRLTRTARATLRQRRSA